ncbi:MAG: hypothetical protein HFI76_14470 [Lachnospiraceae bacterium]|nr:hypothetical protein [Lachnospiraceae bacterium]
MKQRSCPAGNVLVPQRQLFCGELFDFPRTGRYNGCIEMVRVPSMRKEDTLF